jgi:hypothetical protein
MRHIVSLDPVRIPPDCETILTGQGVPAHHDVPERVRTLVEEARVLYGNLSEPRGMVASLSLEKFLEIYHGEGHNPSPAPVPQVAKRADHLALFSATLGKPVCDRIKALFAESNPALGYMLDTIASERADAAADLLAEGFRQSLLEELGAPESTTVLPYSPGYCGWHITGQRRLFAFLEPQRIGVSLNESCLMQPIKSVSGVLLAGPREAHDFLNDFDFCLDCTTWECRSRISSLFQAPQGRTQGAQNGDPERDLEKPAGG